MARQADPAPSQPTPLLQTVKTGAAVVVLGVAGFIVYRVVKAISGTLANIGDVIDAVSGAVQDVAAVPGAVIGGIASLGGGPDRCARFGAYAAGDTDGAASFVRNRGGVLRNTSDYRDAAIVATALAPTIDRTPDVLRSLGWSAQELGKARAAILADRAAARHVVECLGVPGRADQEDVILALSAALRDALN